MSKVVILEDWIEDLKKDKNLSSGMTPYSEAYILYALYKYNISGEQVDLGEVFGAPNGILNFVLPGLYTQIDKIKGTHKGVTKASKYDNEAIEELAASGMGPKAICDELGLDPAKAKSLSSNKGYKAGRERFLAKEKLIPQTFGF